MSLPLNEERFIILHTELAWNSFLLIIYTRELSDLQVYNICSGTGLGASIRVSRKHTWWLTLPALLFLWENAPQENKCKNTLWRVPLGYFSKNLRPSYKDKNDRLESVKVNIKSPCHSGLATRARFIWLWHNIFLQKCVGVNLYSGTNVQGVTKYTQLYFHINAAQGIW